jgi:hypothetical protein
MGLEVPLVVGKHDFALRAKEHEPGVRFDDLLVIDGSLSRKHALSECVPRIPWGRKNIVTCGCQLAGGSI